MEVKKIKVLVFAEFFYPHKNGVREYILNLYGELIKKKLVEVTVVSYNNTKSKKEEFYRGFRIIRIPCISLLNGTYNLPSGNWRKVLDKLSNEKFDVVNSHTRFFTISYLAYRFAKKNKIKFIHTEHGAMFVPHSNFIVKLLARVYDETLGRRIISKADLVCPISKRGDNFVKQLGAKNTKIIYNGIASNIPKISIDTFNFNLKNNLNLVFVGRLVREKGVQDLIEVCSKLKFKYNLFIIGDGNYRNELEKLSSSLNVNSTFLGFREKDYIMSFLPKMDIFVNPSYAEGFPTSVLEAGISGIRVIATDVGGTREILGKSTNSILFKPKNINALEKAILKLKSNKKNLDLKKRISNYFLWENISIDFMEVLENGK